jgi:cell division septum initiation protein DivIVA
MSASPIVTGLTDQYRSRVTADLEANSKEQERLSTEITALQKQLALLQHEHTVLRQVQQALDAAPPEQAPATANTSLPSPRKKASLSPASGKAIGAKKPATGNNKPARKAAPKKTPTTKPAAGTPSQPTLVELVRHHLAQHHEPRSAAEVAASLGQAHPDRGIKTTVVRSTLEGLVAKNRIQRTRQGNSVFYSAPATDDTPAEPQPSAPTEPVDS